MHCLYVNVRLAFEAKYSRAGLHHLSLITLSLMGTSRTDPQLHDFQPELGLLSQRPRSMRPFDRSN